MTNKILVVCMLDGVHSARWLAQFKDEDLEFLLFPSSPNRRIHPLIQILVTGNSKAKFSLFPGSAIIGLPLWALDQVSGNLLRGKLLSMSIRSFRPQVLHALELTNAGYISMRALRHRKPAGLEFIATNWGSDIHWFQRFPAHRRKLERLLAITDKYSCECERDVRLAKELGFRGEVLPVIPNAGGFSSSLLGEATPLLADRKIIAVKGYHGWAGRAKVALDALELLMCEVAGFEIVVFSANLATARHARKISKRTGLRITVHKKFDLSHEQMLNLFSRARIYIGLSVTDGISTSMLESMAMGSVPVQSSTSCCEEWFSDSGVSVPGLGVDEVAAAILKGLELANNQAASDENRAIIRQRARADSVAVTAKSFYQ